MYAIGMFDIFRPGLIWTLISDGDDLDKFAAEEAAMDTTADESTAASKSQAVESLREVGGEEKPPGDEEEDWFECIYLSWKHTTHLLETWCSYKSGGRKRLY